MTEFMLPCLDAVGAKSVVEIGAYAGDLTNALLDWGSETGASVAAVDPAPPPPLVELSELRPELELIRETSHEALRHIEMPDAMVIDGDHNYHVVLEELRLIDRAATWSPGPFLIFHDVSWPHARRDTYYGPDRIPDQDRHPMVMQAGLVPGEPGLVEGGLPMVGWTAKHEGGARNGVLTAIEDFINGRDEFRFVIIPMFFGLGFLWHRDAPWGQELEAIVEPFDRNPVLERLEMNRVHHLASGYLARAEIVRLRALIDEYKGLMRTLRDSRAFRVADRLSELRGGHGAVSWHDQIENLINKQEPGQPGLETGKPTDS